MGNNSKFENIENDEDRPFTSDERRHLRELMVADKRRVWIVSTIKTVSMWVSTVAAAYIIMQDAVKKFFHPMSP